VSSSTLSDSPANDVVDDEASTDKPVEKKGGLKCSYRKRRKAYFNEENWT